MQVKKEMECTVLCTRYRYHHLELACPRAQRLAGTGTARAVQVHL